MNPSLSGRLASALRIGPLLAALLVAQTAEAADDSLNGEVTRGAGAIVVTTFSDWTPAQGSDGECSLREALLAARSKSAVDTCPSGTPGPGPDGPAEDLIQLAAGTYEVEFGSLFIESRLVLEGVGSDQTVISAVGDHRVLECTYTDQLGGSPALHGLAIEGGRANEGAGIYNRGRLVLRNVRVADNEAERGGGIFNAPAPGPLDPVPTLVIIDSLIEDNLVRPQDFEELRELGGPRFQGGGIYSAGSLAVRGTTFSNNHAEMIDDLSDEGQVEGGGLWFGGAGTVEESSFEGNVAEIHSQVVETYARGGAVFALGSGLTLSNVTVSGNQAVGVETAAGVGGGVFAEFLAPDVRGVAPPEVAVTLDFVTVVENQASSEAGGLAGALEIGRSIVLSNSAPGGSNCSAAAGVSTLGYNLFEDTESECPTASSDQAVSAAVSYLGPLADNGGSTRTHRLLAGSPAINAAPAEARGLAFCDQSDGRGFDRSIAGDCDLGAYEVTENVAVDLGAVAGTTPGSATTFSIHVTNYGYFPQTVDVSVGLPAGLDGCEWTCVPTSFGGDGGRGVAACSPGPVSGGVSEADLVLGGSSEFRYDFMCGIASDVVGEVLMPTSASVAGFDPVSLDNARDLAFSVNPLANLALTASAPEGPEEMDEQFELTLELTNEGPSDAQAVQLAIDSLSAGVITSVDCAGGSPATPGGGNICDFASLPAGSVQTVVLTVMVTGEPGQSFDLGASSSASTAESSTLDNEAQFSQTILPKPLFVDDFESAGTSSWSRVVG